MRRNSTRGHHADRYNINGQCDADCIELHDTQQLLVTFSVNGLSSKSVNGVRTKGAAADHDEVGDQPAHLGDRDLLQRFRGD